VGLNMDKLPTAESDGTEREAPKSRPVRADAQRNIDALLEAALAVFATSGVDAPVREIAEKAGVGIGTLYRHFPTRLDLLMAAFQPRLREFLDGATKALEMDDPWEGFAYYLENLFRVQAGDRGFNDFLSRRFTDNAETERIHDQMCQQIGDVLVRAQEAGTARGVPGLVARHEPRRPAEPAHRAAEPDPRLVCDPRGSLDALAAGGAGGVGGADLAAAGEGPISPTGVGNRSPRDPGQGGPLPQPLPGAGRGATARLGERAHAWRSSGAPSSAPVVPCCPARIILPVVPPLLGGRGGQGGEDPSPRP